MMEELIIDSMLDSKQFLFYFFNLFSLFTFIKNVRSVGATGTNNGALTKLIKNELFF